MQILTELRFTLSCAFLRGRGEKLAQLTKSVSSLVQNSDITGLQNFVDGLRVECEVFLQRELHARFPAYNFMILNTAGYSLELGRIRVLGFPVPPAYYQTQAITIPKSPFLILLNLERILQEAVGDTPSVSFLSCLVLTIMEELFHVLHFEWKHDKVHRFAKLSAEKFLDHRLPDELVARISDAL